MRKEWLVPLAVAGVAVAFVVICALVYLCRAHPALVRRKLRVGALLLSLTSVGCEWTPELYRWTCYAPIAPNQIYLVDADGYPASAELKVDLARRSRLPGLIIERTSDSFSFQVADALERVVDAGEIVAADGVYDEAQEEFEIRLREDLPAGDYVLRLFSVGAAAQQRVATNGVGASYRLTVVGPGAHSAP